MSKVQIIKFCCAVCCVFSFSISWVLANTKLELEQKANALTLEATVDKALNWDSGLSGLVNKHKAQLEYVYQKQTEYYPQPNLSFSKDMNNSKKGYVSSISVTQLLYSFGRVSSQIESLKARGDQSILEVFVGADEVAERAALMYVDIKRYEEFIPLAEMQLQSVENITALARERSDAGAASKADLVQAEARLETARLQLNTLHLEHKNLLINLSQMIGEPVTKLSKERINKELYSSLCRSANIDFNAVPRVQMASAGVTVAQKDKEAARRDGMPTIALQGSYQHRINGQYDNGYSRNDHSIELIVNAPLGSVYTTGSKQRAASYQENAALDDLKYVKNIIENNWRNNQVKLDEIMLRIKTLDSRNIFLKEVVKLYKDQYVLLGQRSILDLLNADQELHQSRRELVAAEYDYLAISISCASQLGRFRESLNPSNTVRGVSR
ncbi:TolC family protein [Pseudomonas sp. F1_0610]|uniref:TolC family protein n=1 Tax=Pseudomonas sp. F1_0610 TaxID=3114284 RepID=UPI0039C31F5C